MPISLSTPTGKPFDFDIRDSEIIIVTEGGGSHRYQLRAINDLHHWLKITKNGDWIHLGSRGEEEEPNIDTVEHWARSQENPAEGFYGVTNGRRGRFASYIPSILEALGLAVVEHNPRNNRVRSA